MGDVSPVVAVYGFSALQEGGFHKSGLLSGLGAVFILLLSAWAVSYQQRVEASASAFHIIFIPLFVVAVLQEVLGVSVPQVFAWRWLDLCLWGWGFGAAAIAWGRYLGLSLCRRVMVLVLMMGCGWGLEVLGANDFTLWAPGGEDFAVADVFADPRLVDESVLYVQPALLQSALDSVQPGRQGLAELYLVAVDGDGGQDVFLHEVEHVEQLFATRFGTRGHSIVLVNSPETISDRPVASTIALRAALMEIGRKMNREEDILFLFMASHGATDGRFVLELGPYEFGELTPASLRSLLDESGIKNRIVVVSACYSGSFAEQLAGPWSLTISASRADRSSHGCRQGAEWTFFGKAYFDEALRHTLSFEQAFTEARQSVAGREQQERLPASLPQMFVGQRIKGVLTAWQTATRSVRR